MCTRALPIAVAALTPRRRALGTGCEKNSTTRADRSTAGRAPAPARPSCSAAMTRADGRFPICRLTPRPNLFPARRRFREGLRRVRGHAGGPPAAQGDSPSSRPAGVGRRPGSRARRRAARPGAGRGQGRGWCGCRTWADEADPARGIDGYLIDWYCVASYEDRAKDRVSRAARPVMRLVGPRGGQEADGRWRAPVITAPRAGAGCANRIGDLLLLGLAATGHPDRGFVLVLGHRAAWIGAIRHYRPGALSGACTGAVRRARWVRCRRPARPWAAQPAAGWVEIGPRRSPWRARRADDAGGADPRGRARRAAWLRCWG